MTDYAKGDVLQSLRAKARLSRESAAAEIGVTSKTLFTWEKKSGPIKWENAQRIAAFYDVDPELLVTRDHGEAQGLPSRDQLDRIEANLEGLAEAVAGLSRKLDQVAAAIGVPAGDDTTLGERMKDMTDQFAAQLARLHEAPQPPPRSTPRKRPAPATRR